MPILTPKASSRGRPNSWKPTSTHQSSRRRRKTGQPSPPGWEPGRKNDLSLFGAGSNEAEQIKKGNTARGGIPLIPDQMRIYGLAGCCSAG